MKSVFDSLPIECLVNILKNVEIADFDDGISKLGYLNKCGLCADQKVICKHLRESEIVGIKILKLVCINWRDCIRCHFPFKSGPRFVLPDNSF